MSDRVPELLVEKLALGELSEGEARSVRERLGAAADERIEAVERSNVELLADHPPDQIAAAVRRRLDERGARHRKARGGWWLALPTIAAAAGALFWIGSRGPEELAVERGGSDTGEPVEVITLKGDARLVIQRRRGAEDRQVGDGDSVRAGDLLQIGYQSGGQAQGVILSIDGRGVVTLHHPAGPEGAVALAAGGAVTLPSAFELDDAPGYERFFFVTADAVSVEQVSTAAVRLSHEGDAETGELALPDGWQQSSILLHKE